jgi:hypothetical protein
MMLDSAKVKKTRNEDIALQYGRTMQEQEKRCELLERENA